MRGGAPAGARALDIRGFPVHAHVGFPEPGRSPGRPRATPFSFCHEHFPPFLLELARRGDI